MPELTVLHGDGMTADEAAWAAVADAADEALTIPRLSPQVADELATIRASCRGAAGLPVERSREPSESTG